MAMGLQDRPKISLEIWSHRTILTILTIVTILFIFPISSMAVYASCGNLTGYKPYWKDTFSSGILNKSIWSPRNDDSSWHYDPSMVSINDGKLVLKADNVNGVVKYGAVVTKDKFNFKYAYIRVRAKVIKGNGFLSGFWLTGPNWYYTREELDIMEQLGGQSKRLDMTRHCSTSYDSTCSGSTVSGPWKQSYKVYYADSSWSAAYHNYALEWTPSYVRWLIDGTERFRVTNGIPKDPMWITLSLCGNNCADGWSGPIDYSLLPGKIYVDSVTVCKKA